MPATTPIIEPMVPGIYFKFPIFKIVQNKSENINNIELLFIYKIYSYCAKYGYSLTFSYKA